MTSTPSRTFTVPPASSSRRSSRATSRRRHRSSGARRCIDSISLPPSDVSSERMLRRWLTRGPSRGLAGAGTAEVFQSLGRRGLPSPCPRRLSCPASAGGGVELCIDERGTLSHDGQRFRELYRELGPAVYRRCLRLLGDRELAQDATQ